MYHTYKGSHRYFTSVKILAVFSARVFTGSLFRAGFGNHASRDISGGLGRYARRPRSCVGSYLGKGGLLFILLTADFPFVIVPRPKASERSPVLDLRWDFHGVEIGKTKGKRKKMKDVEGGEIASHRIMG